MLVAPRPSHVRVIDSSAFHHSLGGSDGQDSPGCGSGRSIAQHPSAPTTSRYRHVGVRRRARECSRGRAGGLRAGEREKLGLYVREMALKVVLVGGSGFLGSGLRSRLAAAGDAVTVIGRNPGVTRDRVRTVQWDGKSLGDWVVRARRSRCRGASCGRTRRLSTNQGEHR